MLIRDISKHVKSHQGVPLKMVSFTSKRNSEGTEQILAAKTMMMMLLKSIKSNTLFNQVNQNVILLSLFVCQLTIQYSHGSYIQMPISVVSTAQNSFQPSSPQQQYQPAPSISPLESIYSTVNFYYPRSTFPPDTINSHTIFESSNLLKGHKLDQEKFLTTRSGNQQIDELVNKTTITNEQYESPYEETTAGFPSDYQPTTIPVSDVQIPDFTKHDELNSLVDENSITTKVHFFASKSKRQALHHHSQQQGLDWWSKISKSSSNNHKHHSTKTSQTSASFDQEKSNSNQLENHRHEKINLSGRKKPHSNNNNNNNYNHHHHQQRPAVKGRDVGSTKRGSSTNDIPETTNPTTTKNIYKEQPVNQNAILTLKNQLNAIRSKHKQLMTTSVIQLQQLDNKLIESYKLCFKKKMPLYAGMLYRTRDFVVRMAKDVKHENNVLEAMTKQVQSVLRQRMSNRTLVRDYNQLLATSTEANISRQLHTTSLESVQVQSDQQSIKVVSTNKISSVTKFKKESPFEPSDIPYHVQDNTLSQTLAGEALQQTANKKSRPGNKPRQPQVTSSKSTSLSVDQSGVKNTVQEHDIKSLTTKKPRVKYTVSVNEVNLKKELNKIQALIDRVNGSTHELSAVIDDIVHLFKLTSTDKKSYSLFSKTNKSDKTHTQAHKEDSNGSQQQNDITRTTDQANNRRNRKMLKSPVRVFLEKYGKLTMANFDTPTNNSGNSTVTTRDSDSITNNLNQPDFKPLFDSTNLNYFESSSSSSLDVDTEFDNISTE